MSRGPCRSSAPMRNKPLVDRANVAWCTECVYFEPGHLNYLALRSPERLLVKISYLELSISRSFCFRPFSLSLTWLAVAGPPFIILSWPPPNLCHGDFGKSFVTAKKSLRGFRKLSGRSIMTRPWWESTYKRFSIGEGGETVGGGGESEIPEHEGFHHQYQGQSGEWLVG